MMSHPNTINNFEENRDLKRKLELLYRKEASIRDELEFAASLSLKRPRMEVANWLANVEKLRHDCPKAASEHRLPPHPWVDHQQVDIPMHEVEDLMKQGKGLFEVRGTKVNKLLEDEMVGETFQGNTTKILECLIGNQISRLGIYGMGGVGKTTIMDFRTQRLQDDPRKVLGMGILQENDVTKRATMLSDCLTERGKSTIILDDVREHFNLKEVGIPVRADGIKLVLTTRSFEMQCQEMIKIEPLSHIEAERLFFKELTSKLALHLETEAIVKSIVKECAGLPLAVITMARSMQGVTDMFEWKDFLEKFRESNMGQTNMENKVLMKLEFSCNRLGNHEVQQCFLSCALYLEDERIDKLIGRLDMREKQYVRGLTILNKLANVCLLEVHGTMMKMHDLIRDMALHVMSATSIVKAGKGLRRIPSEEYWLDALEKVSMMKNGIREFPLNMSPNCPKLSTFLMNASWVYDMVIPNSFFKQLWGLKVLNLSGCGLRELPNSISDLINLRALLLRYCVQLRHIPYLGKLKSLRKLDVGLLEGLEMLVRLRYLDISYTRIKRLPKGTLGALLDLQYLRVQAVNGEDITKLGALETLECHFEDVNEDVEEDVDDADDLQCHFEYVDDFNKLVRVVNKQRNNPCYYKLKMGQEALEDYEEESDATQFGNCERSDATVSAGGESSGNGICILIPQHVRKLTVRNCNGTINLSNMGPLEDLEELEIKKWKNLQVLCGGQDEETINIHDSSIPTPAPLLFPSLRVLEIRGCPKLKYLFGHGSKFYLPHLLNIEIYGCEEMVGITVAITSPSPHPPPAVPSLVYIDVREVVESEWLPHFPNLRKIVVINCENMEELIRGPQYMLVEEISLKGLPVNCCHSMRKLFPHELLKGSIMTPVNNTASSSQSSVSLPKLKCLQLRNLPQLKTMCGVSITCDSMEHLEVTRCPELDRIPLRLRLCDIEHFLHIEVEGEEKWKALIWDHPNAQAILQSHFLFTEIEKY
ncbi:hypothetical protein BT93_B0273 [Corymbia citriodora subsp. variegata]|nr:hypothetical protein BT93_B0273 [Corymbia citriodora subsp. variegata]